MNRSNRDKWILHSYLGLFLAICIGCDQKKSMYDLHVDLKFENLHPTQSIDYSKEEPILKLYSPSPDHQVTDLKMIGECRKSSSDLLGTLFSQFEGTCRANGNDILLHTHQSLNVNWASFEYISVSEEEFTGCYKPESWKRHAEQLCSVASKQLIETVTTVGHAYDFKSLSAGIYYLEVDPKYFPAGKDTEDTVGYCLQITRVDLTGGSQVVSEVLKEIVSVTLDLLKKGVPLSE